MFQVGTGVLRPNPVAELRWALHAAIAKASRNDHGSAICARQKSQPCMTFPYLADVMLHVHVLLHMC